MLFVQNPKIELPTSSDVENAVIDNLGFIVELFHEKKKMCSRRYIYHENCKIFGKNTFNIS